MLDALRVSGVVPIHSRSAAPDTVIRFTASHVAIRGVDEHFEFAAGDLLNSHSQWVRDAHRMPRQLEPSDLRISCIAALIEAAGRKYHDQRTGRAVLEHLAGW